MRNFVCLPFLLLPTLLLAQGAPDVSTELLIKKLGSANFLDREAAVKLLRNQPKAEFALRQALRSADLETQKRIQAILTYYEGQPLRELKELAKEGRVDEFIKRVAAWPAGKDDAEVWLIVRGFAHTLKDLHLKKGGYKIKLLTDGWHNCQVLCGDRITESTKAKEGAHFVRTRELDVIPGRVQLGDYTNDLYAGCPTVASGKVRYFAESSNVIFACGPVELQGLDVSHTLIVSCDDIVLKCKVSASVVIARGKVTINEEQIANRIIAGKAVVKELGPGGIEPRDCFITENEPNPLGFIRWSEPPKQKVMPKPK